MLVVYVLHNVTKRGCIHHNFSNRTWICRKRQRYAIVESGFIFNSTIEEAGVCDVASRAELTIQAAANFGIPNDHLESIYSIFCSHIISSNLSFNNDKPLSRHGSIRPYLSQKRVEEHYSLHEASQQLFTKQTPFKCKDLH
ncbi:hypothetical protein TNCV_4581731 [Trichonephila clavipes]|nr:hypothetical protein TNCV_4581731 [Trichonephila clavipes]